MNILKAQLERQKCINTHKAREQTNRHINNVADVPSAFDINLENPPLGIYMVASRSF